jgi:hypothetical protein
MNAPPFSGGDAALRSGAGAAPAVHVDFLIICLHAVRWLNGSSLLTCDLSWM